MTITYEYEMNEKETRLAKLQQICKAQMEILEAYEALRGNEEITEEELNEAIAEEEAKLKEAEDEIIRMTWGE